MAHAADTPPTFPADTWWPTVTVGPQPKGVQSLQGKAVVANSGAANVSLVTTCLPKSCSPDYYNPVPTYAVGAGPTSIVQSPGYIPNVYVSNAEANTVTVISNVSSYQPVQAATIPVGTRPAGIGADASFVYVANNGDNTVSVIDQSTNTVVATIPVGTAPWGVAAYLNTVYVANSGDGTVSVIDAKTRTVTNTIAVGTTPSGIAIDGFTLYVANNGSASVSVINTSTMAVTDTIPVGKQPWGIGAGNGAFFVANYGDGTVMTFDAATHKHTATLTTGGAPFGLSGYGGQANLIISDTAANKIFTVPLGAPTWSPTWSSNKAKRSVTATVGSWAGVEYGIVARSGFKTRHGTCRVSGGKARCTISKLPKGKTWRLSMTTKFPWQQFPGGNQNRKFRF